MAYAVELKGITKTFPGVAANRDVSLAVPWGSIHGLIGENGAGKTTLMKVLYGMYHPNAGEILIDGKTVVFRGPADAIASGIGMVHQHFTLVPSLSVAQNIMLGDNIRNIAGFEAGAREANPDIDVTHLYVGSFEDPTKGKELANTLLDEGYDMILEVCASSSMGIREAIRERGTDVCMIGNCVDESTAIPGQVPFSNFTNYHAWFYNTMQEVAEGRFDTGVIFQGLKEGAVECRFAADDVMKVPQEIKDLVAQYEQQIIDGVIVPPDTLEE